MRVQKVCDELININIGMEDHDKEKEEKPAMTPCKGFVKKAAGLTKRNIGQS